VTLSLEWLTVKVKELAQQLPVRRQGRTKKLSGETNGVLRASPVLTTTGGIAEGPLLFFSLAQTRDCLQYYVLPSV
jgi:hypothetical protein